MYNNQFYDFYQFYQYDTCIASENRMIPGEFCKCNFYENNTAYLV